MQNSREILSDLEFQTHDSPVQNMSESIALPTCGADRSWELFRTGNNDEAAGVPQPIHSLPNIDPEPPTLPGTQSLGPTSTPLGQKVAGPTTSESSDGPQSSKGIDLFNSDISISDETSLDFSAFLGHNVAEVEDFDALPNLNSTTLPPRCAEHGVTNLTSHSATDLYTTAAPDVFWFGSRINTVPPCLDHPSLLTEPSSDSVPTIDTLKTSYLDMHHLPGVYNCFNPILESINLQHIRRTLLPKPGGSVAEPLGQTQFRRAESTQDAKTKATRKKRKLDDEEREQRKRVRRIGSCLRCRIFKEKCDENTPCGRCVEVALSRKIFKQPCYRVSLDDVHTFRAGDADHGQTRCQLPIMQWSPDRQTKRVQLQWPFKQDVTNPPILVIECQKFVPRPKDILKEEFMVNGEVRSVTLPPYACKDTEVTMNSMVTFLGDCQNFLEDEIQQGITDEIVALVTAEALRYRQTYNTDLICRVLRIHAGAMLMSKYLTPVEVNSFDLEAEDETPHYFEKLPLPPVLTYQVQGIIGLIMLKDQAAIMKELKAKIYRQDNVRVWYEIFLTVFVLLSVVEFTYQVQQRYLKVKNGVSNDNFTRVSFATMTMMQEWEASAQNLTQHFRCVVRGAVPFSQSWEASAGYENQRRGGLDDEALAFIRNVNKLLDGDKGQELKALRKEYKERGKYEKPLTWICELFLDDD